MTRTFALMSPGYLQDERGPLLELGMKFLEALQVGKPSLAPLAPRCRFTQNAQEMSIGKGIWHDRPDFLGLQGFADPQQGQVVFCCAAVLAGSRHPFGLRLKIEDGIITEAEAIVSSAAHGHFADVDQMLLPDLIYEAPVPPARGTDRDGLRATADSYWTALQESDGSIPRFGYRCDRYDNGKKITNTLTTLLSPDAAVHTVASCVTATRPARPTVRERRFPVLDVDRGVAVSVAIIDFHPVPSSPRPDSGSFYLFGIFKVFDGEIRIIDEVREILKLGTSAGWK